MNTWKVILATLVIFVAGILTGAMLVRSSVRLGQQRPRFQVQPIGNQNINRIPPTENVRNPAVGGNPPQGNNPNNPNNQFPQLLRREFVSVLDRELNLTPEQHEQIERIVNEGQERISQARRSIEPETRRALQETREQIHNTLTPEQRAQFERLMRQRIQRRLDDPNNPERRPRDQRDQRFQPPFKGPGPGHESGGQPPRHEHPEPPAHPEPPPPPAENP